MSRLILLIFAIGIISGCATENPDQFGKIRELAVKYEIPLYHGIVPQGYTFRDLGLVKGQYTMGFFDEAIDSSLKTLGILSSNAKLMGANAVINVRNCKAGWRSFCYQGEAVDFDNLPANQK